MWPALATVVALLVCAAPASAYPYPIPIRGELAPAADPSLLTVPDANGGSDWYVYATGNQAYGSENRRDFGRMPGAVLPKPLWWQEYNDFGDFWAPEAVYLDGKYWLYYAVSNMNSQHSAIGLATSPTGLPGTWVESGGPILTSGAGKPYNAIDPSILVDYNGVRWMVFGSYWNGIYITRLDPATGRLPANPQFTNIASAAVEGANVVKHGNAYYLFASYGSCCSGHQSSYHVKVGRATSPTGPYHDRAGNPMLGGGGTPVLEGHDWVAGPGGQAVLDDPADQREKFVYHYWDKRVPVEPNKDGRRLGINNLEWDAAGWPYLTGGPRTADVEVAEMESGSQAGPGSGEVMDGWHVFAPGWVERAFSVTDDSPYVLAVSARGRRGGGVWPIMRVWLDGQVLQDRTIDSTQWALYRFDIGRLAPGAHRVRFELINDYFGGNLDDDRNIYIDKLTASSSVDAESMDLRTGVGQTSDGGWVLLGNGRLENAFDFSATGRYVIRVRAKGSLAGGAWPEMRILVDGAIVGKVTVNSSAWTNYDLEVPAAAGERRIAVQFPNDYYGGSWATDRNLWVDTVSAAAVPAKCVYEGPTRPVGRNQDRC